MIFFLLFTQFFFTQDTKVGEEILRLSASDKDSSDHHNNAVFFRIVDGNTVNISSISCSYLFQ